MKIRKLDKTELFDAYLISAYCFHMRIEDTEAEREKIEAEKHEDWGAFSEDGTLMGRIINHRFSFYLDGTEVPTGGIGAVSTLPEYRDGGAVREMFKSLLPDAYENGEVISTLFPFKHSFYRKAGYETVIFKNEYSFAPEVLADYRFDGQVRKWNPGDPADEFLSVYNAFAPFYNMAKVRSKEDMEEHLKVEKPYMDRKFSYILEKDGRAIAYLIFTDIRHDPAAILKVEECAWTCRDGFYAILGFLARFEADYGTIKLPLPAGIDLLRIIQTPRAYEIEKKTGQGFMVRVINAEKLLDIIKKPAGCDLTVKVSDGIIEKNNRTFRVTDGGVTETGGLADIELSVQALGQMAVGAIKFEEAKLRPDVTVNANEVTLRRVFTEKQIFIGEHF